MKRYSTTLGNATSYTAVAMTRINMLDIQFRMKNLVEENPGFIYVEDKVIKYDIPKAKKYLDLREVNGKINENLNNAKINALQNVYDYLKAGGYKSEAIKMLPGCFLTDVIFEKNNDEPFSVKKDYSKNVFI